MKESKIGLITDFDNTLVLQKKFVLNHITATCLDMGIGPPKVEEILEILKTNPPFESIFSGLFGNKGEEVLAKYRESAMDTPFKPVPGGIDAIGKLKAGGCVIIIVSNRTNKLAERLSQAKYDASDFLAIIQPANPKPSNEAYNEALDILDKEGVARANVRVVGDSPDDYSACPDDVKKNFFAVIAAGPNPKEDFVKLGVKEENILDSIAELPDRILNHGRD